MLNIDNIVHIKKGKLLDKCENDIFTLTTDDVTEVSEGMDYIAHILAYELSIEPSDDWEFPNSDLLTMILKDKRILKILIYSLYNQQFQKVLEKLRLLRKK